MINEVSELVVRDNWIRRKKPCRKCEGIWNYSGGSCVICGRERCRANLSLPGGKENAKYYAKIYRKSKAGKAAKIRNRNSLVGKLYERKRGLRRHYGITIEEFENLLISNDNKCGICKTDKPGGKGVFHIDHNHSTGKIRGILCHNCNIGIGHMKEDETRLMQAIEYLRLHAKAA